MPKYHLITCSGGPTLAVDCSPVEYVLQSFAAAKAKLKEFPQADMPSGIAIVYSLPITKKEYDRIRKNKVVRAEPFDFVNPTRR